MSGPQTTPAAPVVPAQETVQPVVAENLEGPEALREAALNRLQEKMAAEMDAATAKEVIDAIRIDPKSGNLTSEEDLLKIYLDSSKFAMEKETGSPIAAICESIYRNFPRNEPEAKAPEPVDLHQELIDNAQKSKQNAQAQAQAEKDKAPFTDMKVQEPQREVTAAAVAMGYLGKAISKAFGSKGDKPGASFEALQAGGQGLGMNNPNMDPTHLADTAMKRMSDLGNRIAQFDPTADPALVKKTKEEFLDAAGDAQRHITNEHRSLLSKMAEGKTHEFDASDTVKERGEKFNDVLKQVDGAEAAKNDEDFKAKAKEAGDKLAEQIKQLMDSIKEMAKKLMSMGNENKAGAPAPGL
jgi:hypothetical protein